MPTTSVGLYEVVLEQTYLNSDVRNVFHYLSNTSDDDVQAVCAQAFEEDLMAFIADTASVSLSYNNIKCVNLTGNLADANRTPAQAAGVVVGDEMPDFVSAGFRYNRVQKDTRNGSKRFGGMVEQNVQAGSFTGAFNVTLDALATALGNDISTVGGVFTPVILRKPDNGAGLWTYANISTVQNLNRVTTQNSRKKF